MHRAKRSKILSATLISTLAVGAANTAVRPSPGADAKIVPWLASELRRAPRASFLVRFDSTDELRKALDAGPPGRSVYERLRDRARAEQDQTRRWLRSLGIPFRTLWVVNALQVEGDLDLARALAARPEVERLVGDPRVPGLGEWGATRRGVEASVEWGVQAVHAPEVWFTDGVRGEGIVVASADTGVEWDHPALRDHYRGWDGVSALHDYNWHDSIADLAVPLDDNNHGTHTTGTMVGDDGAGNRIGVAPGARWIACRNMDHGNGQPSTYLECIQFFLAPWPHGGDPEIDGDPSRAPDVVNNSWTCPPSEGCDPGTLRDGFAALEAAGILAVAAAGNAGPSCSSVSSPPGTYGEALVVGATDSSGTLVSFSSRGPVTVDGSGRMRPDLSAPGSGVRSSVRNAGYSVSSGTSMASPHVAGTAALLWSARPQLRGLVDLTRCLLTRSTGPVAFASPQTCGGTSQATVPNNMSGWGLANAYGAVHLGPDADVDGIGDPCDCAPGDAGAFAAPREVREVVFDADGSTLGWEPQDAVTGPGLVYDSARGDLDALRTAGAVPPSLCLGASASPSLSDPQEPSPGAGFFYLVRARNTCGDGGWGKDSSGAPRLSPGCP